MIICELYVNGMYWKTQFVDKIRHCIMMQVDNNNNNNNIAANWSDLKPISFKTIDFVCCHSVIDEHGREITLYNCIDPEVVGDMQGGITLRSKLSTLPETGDIRDRRDRRERCNILDL